VGAERTGKSQVRICKESTWGSDLVSECMHVAVGQSKLEENCWSKVTQRGLGSGGWVDSVWVGDLKTLPEGWAQIVCI
jgi:hypothetical protein